MQPLPLETWDKLREMCGDAVCMISDNVGVDKTTEILATRSH